MACGKTQGGLIEDTRVVALGYGWSKKAKKGLETTFHVIVDNG